MKTFSISYNGEALEEINAKSKNRVREYIRGFYKDKTYTMNCGGFYKLEKYILKNFEITEIQKNKDLPGTSAYKFEIKLSKDMFNTISDPVLEIITRPTKDITKIGRVIKKMQDKEIGQYDFFPSNMFFDTEYWEPHYVYLLFSGLSKPSDITLNLNGVLRGICATTDKEMISEGANELTVTEDFLIFLNGIDEKN